ncbi:tail fiber protein [Humibacter antri]
MSEPYVGEIRMFTGNFAPVNWAICDGSIVSIAQYDTLFQLLGTTYGGDGQNTFALPDLRGRAPLHAGTSAGYTVQQGQAAGVEQVTIVASQLPDHSHSAMGSSQPANRTSPAGNVWAAWADNPYSDDAPSAALSPSALGPAGGSQAHDNMPPFQVINFIIALAGIYPSPS